jgi:hypothetical protein
MSGANGSVEAHCRTGYETESKKTKIIIMVVTITITHVPDKLGKKKTSLDPTITSLSKTGPVPTQQGALLCGQLPHFHAQDAPCSTFQVAQTPVGKDLGDTAWDAHGRERNLTEN